MTQRKFFYFLLFLLVSTFLYGAYRVLFSQQHVRDYVEEIVSEKQPKFIIDFDSANLSLGKSWIPGIAVELHNLRITSKDICVTRSVLKADYVIIPLSIRAMINHQIHFGHIHGGKVEFSIRPANCSTATNEKSTTQVDKIAPYEKFFQKRWSKEIVNTAALMDGLSIDSLVVSDETQEAPPATINGLQLKFIPLKGECQLTFQLKLGTTLVGEAPFGDLRTKMYIRPGEVFLHSEGNLKEGQFKISSKWAVERGDLDLQISSRDMPLRNVLQLTNHFGILKTYNSNFKNQWLNCDMSMSGRVRDFKSLPILFRQCHLYGDLGEILIKTEEYKSISDGGSVKLQIQNLDIKKFLNSMRLKSDYSFVSSLGRFSGDLEFSGGNQFKLRGEVSDFELYLVMGLSRAREKIERFKLFIENTSDTIAGRASDFVIKKGQVDGGLDFKISSDNLLMADMNFTRVLLPDKIQNTFFYGNITNAQIKAQTTANSEKLIRFTGDIKVDDWNTLAWKLSDIRTHFEYSDEALRLKLLLGKFALTPESKWKVFINSLAQELKPRPKEIVITKLKTDINISEGVAQWTSDYALIDKRMKMTSKGTLNVKSDLTGVIDTKWGKVKKRWSLSGDLSEPKVKIAAFQ